MANFPTLKYSKKQVIKAGEALASPMPWDPSKREEIAEVFRIAHDWRASHAFPMRKIRFELGGKIRGVKGSGTTAARLKRMRSIRKKLGRLSTTLVQIQDIAGCRAILNSMADVHAVAARYRDGASAHIIRDDRSYIENPKAGGYRSHHIVLNFQGVDEEAIYNDRRVEVQLRTHLQHAWATAVEAVGLVRAEDLKAGEGDADWLRLFKLVSSEFAEHEDCAPVPGTGTRAERISEIADLNKKLGAVSTLENLRQAYRFATNSGSLYNKYFLISYDHEKHTVKIVGYNSAVQSADQYSKQEAAKDSINTVLVEVDTLEDLRIAYPNYYLDVRMFAKNIDNIVRGYPILNSDNSATEEPLVSRKYDLSWWFKK